MIISYSFEMPESPVISAYLDVIPKRRYNKVIKMTMQQLNNLVYLIAGGGKWDFDTKYKRTVASHCEVCVKLYRK